MFEEYNFIRLNTSEMKTQDSFMQDIHRFFDLHNKLDDITKYPQTIDIDYRFPHSSGETVRSEYLYPIFFTVVRSQLPPFMSAPIFPIFTLAYLYQGEGILNYNEKKWPLRAGEGFLIPYDAPHHFTLSTDAPIYFYMHFGGGPAPAVYEEFRSAGIITFTTIGSLEFNRLITTVLSADNSLSCHRDFHCHVALQKLLESILFHEEVRRSSQPPAPIIHLRQYMEKNYDRPLSLDALSRQCGLSKYHLSREFKRYTGYSPNEYLIHLRLQRAQFFLSSTNLTIQQIAAMSGFPNESNFRRLFEKKFGKTPSAFRGQPSGIRQSAPRQTNQPED